VRTATLLGVAPLDYKLPLPFGKGVDHALGRLFADCETDAPCHAAFPDLRKEFAAIVERLDKNPLTFDTMNPFTRQKQQVTLTRDGFAEHIRLMLYQPDVMRALPALIHQMYGQDYARFGAIAHQVIRGLDSAMARGMQLSVLCAEDVPFINEGEIKTTLAGTFYGETRARLYVKACEQWPRGDVPAKFREPVKSDIPALMLSGEIDPVNPARRGDSAPERTHQRAAGRDAQRDALQLRLCRTARTRVHRTRYGAGARHLLRRADQAPHLPHLAPFAADSEVRVRGTTLPAHKRRVINVARRVVQKTTRRAISCSELPYSLMRSALPFDD
jgi:hypothetical protein